jgi:hypothetical protein
VLVLVLVVFIVDLETCALSGFTSDFNTQMLRLLSTVVLLLCLYVGLRSVCVRTVIVR